MSQFLMTVLDDGRVVVTTERPIDAEQASAIMRHFAQWRATPEGVLVIGQCRVQRATEFAIDLRSSEAESRHEDLLAEPFAK